MGLALLWTGVALAGLVCVIAVVVAVADSRWQRDTAAAIERLYAQPAVPLAPVSETELADVPPPVARYLRLAIPPGHAGIATVRMWQRGMFQMGGGDRGWRPFTAVQTFRSAPPAFVWDARCMMLPGVPVRIRDSYLDGVGAMCGAVWGLFVVAHPRPAPELDAGSLHRFLGEALWFPTRLAPRDGVRWTVLDDRHARVHLRDGATEVALDCSFAEDGTISRVYTPDRARAIRGGYDTRGWGCDLGGWTRHDGVLVPGRAEVFWELDGKHVPYWRGEIVRLEYTLAAVDGRRAA